MLRPRADELKKIERLRKKLVNPSFELLYQQDVEGQSLPALTVKHFPSFNPDDIADLPRFISIDPGTDEGDGRSFRVIQLWASDGTTHYLVDQARKRCEFSDLVEITNRFARKNAGAPILIEKTANGPALLSALSKKRRRRVVPITPRDPKTTRFRRHHEKFLAGRYVFRMKHRSKRSSLRK